jgi:hypothetical protein
MTFLLHVYSTNQHAFSLTNQHALILYSPRSRSLKTECHFVPTRLEQVKMDIKGTVSRDFLLQIFHEFTASVVDIGVKLPPVSLTLAENLRYQRYQQYRWQNLPPV